MLYLKATYHASRQVRRLEVRRLEAEEGRARARLAQARVLAQAQFGGRPPLRAEEGRARRPGAGRTGAGPRPGPTGRMAGASTSLSSRGKIRRSENHRPTSASSSSEAERASGASQTK